MARASTRLVLAPTARSVSEGRKFVATTMSDWKLRDQAETVTLLASEVITNAVLHTRTEVVVSLERVRGGVIVRVRDGSRRPPQRRRHARDATMGRGMELLEMLADSWDVAVDDAGKTVAFTVTGSQQERWAAGGAAVGAEA